MRSSRQQYIDRAIIRTLAQHSQSACSARVLQDGTDLVIPNMTQSEFDEALRNHDQTYRVAGVPTDYGTFWTLTDVGRAWAAANRL